MVGLKEKLDITITCCTSASETYRVLQDHMVQNVLLSQHAVLQYNVSTLLHQQKLLHITYVYHVMTDRIR